MFWRDFGRYGRPWLSTYGDLDRLQREMDRLFTGIRRPFAPEFPALNIWTNEDGAMITAELPGVCEKDLDISITGNTLVLRGERKAAEDASYYRQERESGSFTRSIELPFQVQADKIVAEMSKGVLDIRLPRAEEDRPRKITIRVT